MKSRVFVLGFAVLLFLVCGMASGAAQDTVYVNNRLGSDQFDGSRPLPGGSTAGPVASVGRGVQLLHESGKLVIANTGTPYRSSLILVGKGGTPAQPLVVEGNNATLEGLQATKPSDWTIEHGDIISMMFPGMPDGFFVVADGAAPVFAKSLEEIQPGESYYNKPQAGKHKGYYRLPSGKRLEDLKLEVPTGGCGCGVEIIGASNIIVRDLKCRYFCDDGFNVQGECEALRFEHIEGYLNGDQGFSCHATVSCTVVDGHFHNNDSGIADTVFSRTSFYGVVVAGNRSYGVLFEGGEHSIVNSRILDNPISITCERAAGANDLPGTAFNPYANCRLFLRDTCVQGGEYGLKVRQGSTAAVNYCVFRDQPTSLIVADDASRLYMINSIVAPGNQGLNFRTGTYWGDYNCWTTHNAEMNEHGLDVLDIDKTAGIETHSLVADPLFADAIGPRLQKNSPAMGKAYVDPTYRPWLVNSGYIDSAHPPEKFPLMYPDLYPNMGCELGR